MTEWILDEFMDTWQAIQSGEITGNIHLVMDALDKGNQELASLEARRKGQRDAALANWDKAEALKEENERLGDFFRRVRVWANAYPLSVFPEPDLKEAAKVLKENGMTLDAISASAMRHVLKGVIEIAGEALEEE